jgi:serine/threonine protein kinase
MSIAAARTPFLQHAVFEDGLGKRYHHRLATSGEPVEILELRDEFCTDAFEHALRERLAVLTAFQRTCFAQVHAIQRTTHNGSTLFVVSGGVSGVRLSTLLAVARQQRVSLEMNANLCLIRQLVTAVALLHEKMPRIAHGAIALERVVITPKGRVVVADHVLGSALAQLRYRPDRYWKDLRVALPPGAQPELDQRADAAQVGIIALELILGRAIDGEEYPDRISDLIERAWTGLHPPPAELRAWLLRMLQLDTKAAFTSAVDAWADLERVLGASPETASFDALESFMTEYARRSQPSTVVSTSNIAAPPPVAAAPAATPSLPPSVAPAAPSPVTPLKPTVVPAATPSPAATAKTPAVPPAKPSPPATPPVVVRATEPAQPPARPRVISEAPVNTDASSTMPRRRRWIAAAAVLVVLASGGALFGRRYLPPAAAEAPGTLVVSTNPSGVPVIVDGQPRGNTPLTLELAAGAHRLELATEGEPRIIPFTLTAGSTVAQTIELPKAVPLTGQLVVRSEPPGARVTIDGTPSGTTPATVEQLAPGTHSVTLQTDLSSVTQEVTIEPGATASLVVPIAPQGVPLSGWIAVDAPAEVQVYEDTRLLGTSQSDRIMVLAGRHELSVVNETLGYRATRTATVSPGKVSIIRLEWPKGSMALNAQPWADVWIDGEKKGETPIGNVSVPIGTHEVVFRHPELGERVVRTTVTATTPARVSVDMRKQ